MNPSPVIFSRLAQARRATTDEAAWLKGLRRLHVDLLVLADHPPFSARRARPS
jgi:hypothetical protein